MSICGLQAPCSHPTSPIITSTATACALQDLKAHMSREAEACLSLGLPATVSHVIDDNSPLANLSVQSMAARHMEARPSLLNFASLPAALAPPPPCSTSPAPHAHDTQQAACAPTHTLAVSRHHCSRPTTLLATTATGPLGFSRLHMPAITTARVATSVHAPRAQSMRTAPRFLPARHCRAAACMCR